MDYRYQVFLAVANNLSFTKAAQEMYISQPAVTRHIRELENTLGLALFNRKGNRITLTAAGEIVYRYAQKTHILYDELQYELGTLKQTFSGSLRLGASSTISQYVIPEVIAAFHTRYPDIEVSLINGNSFEMEQKLQENRIDLAMVENYSSKTDLQYVDFSDDEIVVIAGHTCKFGRNANGTLAELQHIPLVVRERGSGTLEVIEQYLKSAGYPLDRLNVILHLGSTEAIKNFLPRFNGIGLVSVNAIHKEIQLNTLKIIPVKGLNIKRKFRFAYPKGPLTGNVKYFVDFTKNYNTSF
ncbi:LysR family transcriptional regulator [Prolixibacter sp. SD074]|uniref:LysR family transcriptional regulator n=1 Tax=Prolixibacter sp. SD074 TaxID=2652391 RepID=UPI00126FFEF3|nr:LysR family transcriptional regulator [Prolixibacter sp. SD074]GET28584.1 transcriptional regulator [Prolixibacter sp. SD074]